MAQPTDDARRMAAEALADPTRYLVFSELEGTGVPLDVAALTAAAGVHHTVVRAHLAKLVEAGLVRVTTDAPRGRGRPRLLYEVDPAAEEGWGPAQDRYRLLAGLLATAVRTGDSAREVGRAAGRNLGAVLVEGPVRKVPGDPGGDPPPGAIRLLTASAQMGFRPSLDAGGDGRWDVVLHHCPYAEVAAEDPATICSLHLGVAEGVQESSGDVVVEGIEVVDPHTAGCRLHLRATD